MNFKVAWVLVSSKTQVQSQITLNPDYLPDYLSVSYDRSITEAIELDYNKKYPCYYAMNHYLQI